MAFDEKIFKENSYKLSQQYRATLKTKEI